MKARGGLWHPAFALAADFDGEEQEDKSVHETEPAEHERERFEIGAAAPSGFGRRFEKGALGRRFDQCYRSLCASKIAL